MRQVSLRLRGHARMLATVISPISAMGQLCWKTPQPIWVGNIRTDGLLRVRDDSRFRTLLHHYC